MHERREWIAASKLLDRARSLVEERGWQQGSVEEVTLVRCMATALESAMVSLGYSIVDFNYAKHALEATLGLPLASGPVGPTALDIPYWGRGLMEWNDSKGRTEAQVLAAFATAKEFAEANARKSS